MKIFDITEKFNENKSTQDKREYGFLILNNEIKVALVQDTKAKAAACALTINVGNTSDPSGADEINGLAHLCEHMLFQGTTEFPDPTYYSKFISDNSGHHNGMTGEDNTMYHFDIAPDKL